MDRKMKVKPRQEGKQRPRRGTAAALLEVAKQCASIVQPGDVEELERLIEEGCERPGEAVQLFEEEVQTLRQSQAFQQFLEERSRGTRRIALEEIEAEIERELE